MVVSPVDVVDAAGRRIQKKSENAVRKYSVKVSGDDALEGLADDNFIYSSTPLVYREVFSKTGGFDDETQPHDDWDMYLRIALAGYPIYCYTRKPLSVWRKHEFNESHKRMSMMQSKCLVEEKALRSTPIDGIGMILRANLSLDHVVMDNLRFNEGDYAGFRRSLRQHLPDLVKIYAGNGRNDRFVGDYKKRVRKIIVKSVRRYLLSIFRRTPL
jgi:hypothetical protein